MQSRRISHASNSRNEYWNLSLVALDTVVVTLSLVRCKQSVILAMRVYFCFRTKLSPLFAVVLLCMLYACCIDISLHDRVCNWVWQLTDFCKMYYLHHKMLAVFWQLLAASGCYRFAFYTLTKLLSHSALYMFDLWGSRGSYDPWLHGVQNFLWAGC